MEPFMYVDFMTPLKDFLQQPSFLEPGETLTIDYMQIDPTSPAGAGNSMAIAGMARPSEDRDVLGNTVLTETLNLIFTMRRYSNDNELRRDIGNFIVNYIRWINHEQQLRGTAEQNPLLPKFSNTSFESLSASGGIAVGGTVETNIDEFQVQIHLTYQTEFESEEY